MPPKKAQPSPIQPIAIGDGNIQIVGDKNVVNQTIIQKFVNFIRGDTEALGLRNRHIMLNHVEEFWVKGILEKSLYGAALLDLGIKEAPDALSYPWAIKREASQETLPLGKPMLEIFQEIGLGRSLLILGAPGSGKTTMLLELARQLIEIAHQDLIEPIPVVFNLSSWKENLSLADWLARELNTVYSVSKKISSTWIKENKMLLLLDGLDEVRQESRDKCVEAINAFRNENGLTSMAISSRSQEYTELNTRLSFNGAIEIQPLTSTQVNDYFKRFSRQLAGIRQVLEKDTILREMAETPLFLSIMTLAYRDKQSVDILISKNIDAQHKHLFDTYIDRMFERPERSKNEVFKKQEVLHRLAWLAKKMNKHNQIPYLLERMQPEWLSREGQLLWYCLLCGLVFGLVFGLIFVVAFGLTVGLIFGTIFWVIGGLIYWQTQINTVDAITWEWQEARSMLVYVLVAELIVGLIVGLFKGLTEGLITGLFGMVASLLSAMLAGLKVQKVAQTTRPGQRLSFTMRNFFITSLPIELFIGLVYKLIGGPNNGLFIIMLVGLILVSSKFGGSSIIQHYTLRLILGVNKLLPWKLVPFLDYCTDLIFLRRVGGGYIFVHRLLMEHFAAMYPESDK